MYKWAEMMKRILTMAFVLGVAGNFVSPSYAIDAKKKSGAAAPAAHTDSAQSAAGAPRHKAASSQTLLERLKMEVRESSKSPDSSKYDNYIDANNDGVDDRVKERPNSVETVKSKESEKARQPEKTRESAKSKVSAPARDDSARVKVKKKPK